MAKILKDRTNQTIMDAIRSDMPLSYQSRIPAATQAGVKNTAEQLFNYRPMLNEFVDALVNHIHHQATRDRFTMPVQPRLWHLSGKTLGQHERCPQIAFHMPVPAFTGRGPDGIIFKD